MVKQKIEEIKSFSTLETSSLTHIKKKSIWEEIVREQDELIFKCLIEYAEKATEKEKEEEW